MEPPLSKGGDPFDWVIAVGVAVDSAAVHLDLQSVRPMGAPWSLDCMQRARSPALRRKPRIGKPIIDQHGGVLFTVDPSLHFLFFEREDRVPVQLCVLV